MKTKSFIIALSVFFALGLTFPLEVSAHGPKPPAWAPAHGFREHTRQVYFPKYNCYYDVVRGNYIYINNGRWTVSVNLPVHYRTEYFRTTPYVELNINSRYPQYFNAEHRAKYSGKNYYKKDRNYYDDGRKDKKQNKENKHWDHEKNMKHHGHK